MLEHGKIMSVICVSEISWSSSKTTKWKSQQSAVCCLPEAIRIVSREKTELDAVTTEKALKILLNHAGLDMSCLGEESDSITIQDVFGIDCCVFLWKRLLQIEAAMVLFCDWERKREQKWLAFVRDH